MRITDVMTHPIKICDVDANLAAVAQLMWNQDCGVIPVVDHDGRLAGMVTDRDICMAAYTQGKTLAEIPVRTAMTAAVLSCHESSTVETVERLMREGQVHRIPVVDDGQRPVGIVAMNDLARMAARLRKGAIEREVVQTLAAVCEPRAQMALDQMNHAAGRPSPA